MVKFLKCFGIVVLFAGVMTVALMSWIDRSQRIDFTKYIPDVWETCEGRIESGTARYEDLKFWIQSNKSNWRNSFATAPTGGYTYSSDKIRINVYDSDVIIRYRTKGSWTQMSQQADTVNINGTCH